MSHRVCEESREARMAARGLRERRAVEMRSGLSAGPRSRGALWLCQDVEISGVWRAEVCCNLLYVSRGFLWMLGEEQIGGRDTQETVSSCLSLGRGTGCWGGSETYLPLYSLLYC